MMNNNIPFNILGYVCGIICILDLAIGAAPALGGAWVAGIAIGPIMLLLVALEAKIDKICTMKEAEESDES